MDERDLGSKPRLGAGTGTRKKSLIAATDRYYLWLRNYITSSLPDGLPQTAQFHDLELAKRIYAALEAWGWRFLPSQIQAEDWQIMEDVLQLRLHANIAEKALAANTGGAAVSRIDQVEAGHKAELHTSVTKHQKAAANG